MQMYDAYQTRIANLEARIEALEKQIAATTGGGHVCEPDGEAGAAKLPSDPDESLREAIDHCTSKDAFLWLPGPLEQTSDTSKHIVSILQALKTGRLIIDPRWRPASEWPGNGKPRVWRFKKDEAWAYYVDRTNIWTEDHQFLDMDLPE